MSRKNRLAGGRGRGLGYSATAIAALVFGVAGYRGVLELSTPRNWVPVQVHQVGMDLAGVTNHGRVLTLAPIFPLEGGCDTYEELATGRLHFGSAGCPESRRNELRVLDSTNLHVVLGRPASPSRAPSARNAAHWMVSFIAYALSHRIPIFRISDQAAQPSAEPWEPTPLSLEVVPFNPAARDDSAIEIRR